MSCFLHRAIISAFINNPFESRKSFGVLNSDTSVLFTVSICSDLQEAAYSIISIIPSFIRGSPPENAKFIMPILHKTEITFFHSSTDNSFCFLKLSFSFSQGQEQNKQLWLQR